MGLGSDKWVIKGDLLGPTIHEFHKRTQWFEFFFFFEDLYDKAALVAVSKTSLTPSPVLAEHST